MEKCISTRMVLILLILLPVMTWSQSKKLIRLAILPFASVGVDEATLRSSEALLRYELSQYGTLELIPESEILNLVGAQECSEIPCALQIGQQLNADEVSSVKLVALGEKVIVQFMLLDVKSQSVKLMDKATATIVEDLDAVMKRIARSMVQNLPMEKTAEVGNITEQETLEPRRRGSRKLTALSFGYLYPQEGYDNVDRSFTMDLRLGSEVGSYAIGMQLAARKGFAVNVFGSHYFTRTDLSPYVGGAFGFHWVSHQNYYYYDYGYVEDLPEKRADGFELTLNTGLVAFHTYDTQLIFSLAYSYTLNDFNDRAVIFTLGLQR